MAVLAFGAARTRKTASAQDSANSDTQSRDLQAGTTPPMPTRPGVGFRPTMLLKPAGTRPEPAVSVPREKLTRPAATAIADPELEPPGTYEASKGFRGTP